MESMVGTITPKKVFSLRGSGAAFPELDSWGESHAEPHVAAVRVSPQTPELIRGERSLGMTAENEASN